MSLTCCENQLVERTESCVKEEKADGCREDEEFKSTHLHLFEVGIARDHWKFALQRLSQFAYENLIFS
jgi:hypothetical protein